MRVGGVVMGLISFEGIVRPRVWSAVPLPVAFRRFIGYVMMGVLVLVGRLW